MWPNSAIDSQSTLVSMGSNYSIHECFILAQFFFGGGGEGHKGKKIYSLKWQLCHDRFESAHKLVDDHEHK